MNKIFKSILAVSLCMLLLFGTVAIGGDGLNKALEAFTVKASAAKITSFSTGDTFEFGWYPQSKETDPTVISALNELGGDNTTWTSYNYYIGTGKESDGQMTPSDFMRYTDVMYGNAKYRGVIFDSYRPWFTSFSSSEADSFQDDNGYATATTYWFKYEPIKWRVLDPTTGLVLSDTILDSQTFNNYSLYFDYKVWGDSEKTYYANNYINSNIRQWLNNDLYNTAFSEVQQDIICFSVLDNSAHSTQYSSYDSFSTIDKIFPLSWSDALNSNYGFNTNERTEDTARIAKGSDYAKCQGLGVSSEAETTGYSYWGIRSAGDHYSSVCAADVNGTVFACSHIGEAYIGVRPALKLNLTSDIIQSSVSEIGKGTESGCNGKINDLHTGDIIEFGWYPQTMVTGSETYGFLTELYGDTTTWTSYDYYSGTGDTIDGQMKPSNYMRYKDIMVGYTKYRGVIFDSYRPYCTGYTSLTSNTYQDDNGYTTGTIYWFKYEPIKWRVLDPSTGLVLTETILDSQAYNNYILSSGTDEYGYTAYWGDSEKTYYANNYAKSSIRQWLNNDFYNTAFSTSQQNIIQSTKLNNSACSAEYSAFNSASTTDKIFLLSWSDVLKYNYGFGSNSARRAKGSDYAKCQGLFVSTNGDYTGNSHWRLRSAGINSNYSCSVYYVGYVDDFFNANSTDDGVRAAFKLNPTSDIFQSLVSETGKGNNNGCGPVEEIIETDVIKGNAANNQKTYAYKTAVTFTANVPEGGSAEWFVDGKSVGNGESFTVSAATKSYTIKVIVTDKDGNTSFDTETVTIKNSFWDKISYFFKHLFNPSSFIVNQ